jgi:hypothetical protein
MGLLHQKLKATRDCASSCCRALWSVLSDLLILDIDLRDEGPSAGRRQRILDTACKRMFRQPFLSASDDPEMRARKRGLHEAVLRVERGEVKWETKLSELYVVAAEVARLQINCDFGFLRLFAFRPLEGTAIPGESAYF